MDNKQFEGFTIQVLINDGHYRVIGFTSPSRQFGFDVVTWPDRTVPLALKTLSLLFHCEGRNFSFSGLPRGIDKLLTCFKLKRESNSSLESHLVSVDKDAGAFAFHPERLFEHITGQMELWHFKDLDVKRKTFIEVQMELASLLASYEGKDLALTAINAYESPEGHSFDISQSGLSQHNTDEYNFCLSAIIFCIETYKERNIGEFNG